jgi:FixJ family two-component response regulator
VTTPIVYVVDDEPDVAGAIASVVRSFGYEVETFTSAADFLRHPRRDADSCLLLDVNMPGSDGFDVVADLAKNRVGLPTVFITGGGTIPMSVRAMKTGAIEFLTKPLDWNAVRTAIEQALARDAALRADRAELAELEAKLDRLTDREREVLAEVVAGKINKRTAADLGVVEQTIKVHRARILKKLEVTSVAELVRLTERIAVLRG